MTFFYSVSSVLGQYIATAIILGHNSLKTLDTTDASTMRAA